MSTSKFKVGDKLEALVNRPVSMAISAGDVIEIGRIEDGLYVTNDSPGWVFKDVDAHMFKLIGGPSFVGATASEVTNPLYHYRASEETGNDAWGTLAKAVAHNTSWPDVKQQFKDWEVEYTSVTSLPLPHAWRSAKSVIKRAFEHSIPIVQRGGEARGKTAVEKDIKAAKEKDKEVLTPQETLDRMLDRAVNYASQHNLPFTAQFIPKE